jgi:hypothetical protein
MSQELLMPEPKNPRIFDGGDESDWTEFLKAKTGILRRPPREPEPNLPTDWHATCWFEWGSTIAVTRAGRAFSGQRNGWGEVHVADVMKFDDHERWQISETTARRRFAEVFEAFGDPPFDR